MEILFLYAIVFLLGGSVAGVVALVWTISLESRLKALEQTGLALHETKAERVHTPEPSPYRPTSEAVQTEHAHKFEFKLGAWFYSAVGGVAVLFGLGFLLRYAIENDLISPELRVLLGLVTGAILIGLGEWLRPTMKRYANILTGTGLGAFYLSLYAASQLYALVPLEIAFIGMMIVTALGVFLAWRTNSQTLAIFAAIGGYLTPLILSLDTNRVHVILPYLIILESAMLLIAWKKPWRWLVGISLFGTSCVYLAWSTTYAVTTSTEVSFIYITLLFLPFLGRTLYRAWTETKADEMDFVLLFLSPLLYALAGKNLIEPWGKDWMAGFTFVMSLLYLALAVSRYIVHKTAKTYDIAFTAIGATLLAATTAVYFDTMRWVVFSWAVEALALQWTAKKFGSQSLAWLSNGLFLVAGMIAIGQNETKTSLLCLVPFLVQLFWNEWKNWTKSAKRPEADAFHFIATHVFVLWFAGAEILRAWDGNLSNSLMTVSWLVYAVLLTAYGIWRKDHLSRYAAVTLFGLSTAKIILVDTATLDNFYRFVVFISLGLLLLLSGFLYNRFKGKIE